MDREVNIVQHLVSKVMLVQTKEGLRRNELEFDDIEETHKVVKVVNQDYEYNYLYARMEEYVHNMVGNQYAKLMSAADALQIAAVSAGMVPLHSFAHDIETSVNAQTVESVAKKLGNNEFQQGVKKALEDLSTTECSICMDSLERPTITSCSHLFCNECITQALQHRRACPLCRTPIALERLVEISQEKREVVVEGDEVTFYDELGRKCKMDKSIYEHWHSLQDKLGDSEKFKALEKIINNTKESVVVFSRHAVVLHGLCKKFPHAAVITGKSSRSQRKIAVDNFQNKRTNVFILSTRCASVGLTLTSGSCLVFMEPLLDQTAVKQAIGRIARTGQKRAVSIYTLVTENTIDETYIEMRERYEELCDTDSKKLASVQKRFKTHVVLSLF